MNQYPHQEEMDLVLEALQEEIKFGSDNPWEAILDFKECSSDEDRHAWANLNDLEEAVVLKNFAVWYQQEYTHKFPNGRERL